VDLRPARLLPPKRLLTPRSARDLSITNRGLLPGSPAITRTGLSPAGLVQFPGRNMEPIVDRGARTDKLPDRPYRSVGEQRQRQHDGAPSRRRRRVIARGRSPVTDSLSLNPLPSGWPSECPQCAGGGQVELLDDSDDRSRTERQRGALSQGSEPARRRTSNRRAGQRRQSDLARQNGPRERPTRLIECPPRGCGVFVPSRDPGGRAH